MNGPFLVVLFPHQIAFEALITSFFGNSSNFFTRPQGCNRLLVFSFIPSWSTCSGVRRLSPPFKVTKPQGSLLRSLFFPGCTHFFGDLIWTAGFKIWSLRNWLPILYLEPLTPKLQTHISSCLLGTSQVSYIFIELIMSKLASTKSSPPPLMVTLSFQLLRPLIWKLSLTILWNPTSSLSVTSSHHLLCCHPGQSAFYWASFPSPTLNP